MTGIHRKIFFKSDNCPSWWPKDVVFSPVRGIIVRSTHSHTVYRCFQNVLLIVHVGFYGVQSWCHCCKPKENFGSFLGELSRAVHNVSSNAHQFIASLLMHCRRSPPIDQQNSASTVETDQPEDPTAGTKRARMMPGSKIVLPSSDVEEYFGIALCSTISRILILGGSNNN